MVCLVGPQNLGLHLLTLFLEGCDALFELINLLLRGLVGEAELSALFLQALLDPSQLYQLFNLSPQLLGQTPT